jgi:hypothetical protein
MDWTKLSKKAGKKLAENAAVAGVPRVVVEKEVNGALWTIAASPKDEQDLDDVVEDIVKALKEITPEPAAPAYPPPQAPPGYYYPPGSMVPVPLPVQAPAPVTPAPDTPTAPVPGQ